MSCASEWRLDIGRVLSGMFGAIVVTEWIAWPWLRWTIVVALLVVAGLVKYPELRK